MNASLRLSLFFALLVSLYVIGLVAGSWLDVDPPGSSGVGTSSAIVEPEPGADHANAPREMM